MKKDIINIDCTLRDGGYYNNWDFPEEFVKKYLIALSIAKIKYVEIGYRLFENKGFKGAYAFCNDGFLNSLSIPAGINVSIMINSDDLILNGQFNREVIEILLPLDSSKSKVDLVRIACTYDDFEIIAPAFKILKEKGYKTAINIMQISKIKNHQLNKVARIAAENDVDIIYLADSFGSLIPETIEDILNNPNIDIEFIV